MNYVEQCIELTEQLIHLAKNNQTEQREELIQEITRLLEEREQILPQIIPPFSEDEKSQGELLITLSKQLEPLLKDIQDEIQKEMVTVKKKKVSAKLYRDPYSTAGPIDGMFYDKRN